MRGSRGHDPMPLLCVAMIEHHYGALIDGAHAGIVGRLDAIETTLEESTTDAAESEAR